MPRYIPFLRVSTKAQDTDRQLADITRYATTQGWELAPPISETVSGAKKNFARAGIQAVLQQARRGDVVLATEISRIGRDTAQVLLFLEELADRGVNVYVLNANLHTLRPDGSRDPMAWAMLTVGALFGALERAGIRERVLSGIEHARSQGRVGGRPVGAVKTADQLLDDYPEAVKRLRNGTSVRDVAKLCEMSTRTVLKLRKVLFPAAGPEVAPAPDEAAAK